jgi:surface protein
MAVLIHKKSGSPIVSAKKLSGRTILGGDKNNSKVMDWFECTIDTTLGDGTNDYHLSNHHQFFVPNADVSWGDGDVEALVDFSTALLHSYASSGTYNVRVVGLWRMGKINSWQSGWSKTTDILRWGELGETGGLRFNGGVLRTENAIASPISAPDQPYVDNIETWSATFREISNTGVNVDWFLNWTFPTVPLSATELFYNFKGLSGSTATTINLTQLKSTGQGASNINPDVTNWDVSGVGNARGAFISCSNFTGVGLPGWDVSNMSDMYLLLQGCAVNQDLSSWNFASMTEGRNMFAGQQGGIFNCGDTPATGPGTPGSKVATWHFPLAVNMSSFFSGNSGFNQDCTRVTTPGSEAWDFPATLTTIGGMFSDCTNFNGNVENWNVSNIEDMGALFRQCTHFNQDLTTWDVSNVTNMSFMFFLDSNWTGLGISGWNTGKVEDLSRAFYGTTCNVNIVGWDVSSLTNIYQLCYLNGANFTRDLSGWNTVSLDNANNAFQGCDIDFSFGDWNLKSLTTMNQMVQQSSTFSDANVADSLEGWYERGYAPATGVNAQYWCGNAGLVGRSMSIATYTDAKTAFDALIAAVTSVSTGTNTSITTNKLVDSSADFVTDGVAQYDWVENTTTGERAIVTAVDNLTTLSLTVDIFTGTGESYEVGRGYAWDMTGAISWT